MEKVNLGFLLTGKRLHVALAWSKQEPRGLFGFHLALEVMKKFRVSTWKIPLKRNSDNGA